MRRLRLAIGIVSYVLAAFSGVIIGIAPPEGRVFQQDPKMLTGLLSFALLVVLLLVWTIIRVSRKRSRRGWAVTAALFTVVFLGMAGKYYFDYGTSVFVYLDGQKIVAGDSLTDFAGRMSAAEAAKNQGVPLSKSELLAKVGGPRSVTAIWTPSSIANNEKKLALDYALLMLCLATAIFAAIEGALGPRAGSVGLK